MVSLSMRPAHFSIGQGMAWDFRQVLAEIL